MQIKIDLLSKIPIYVQVIDQIKHMIAIGTLKPGDQLPTVRQMAADLRVNFNTIARAYRMLDEEGLISTQHGRGTFILAPASEANGNDLRRQDIEWLTRRFLNDAASLEYSAEQISEIFMKNIQLWFESGSPPPEHDSEM